MKPNLTKSLLALWVAFMIGLTACGSTSQVDPTSTSVEPITQSQTETAETNQATAQQDTSPPTSSSSTFILNTNSRNSIYPHAAVLNASMTHD